MIIPSSAFQAKAPAFMKLRGLGWSALTVMAVGIGAGGLFVVGAFRSEHAPTQAARPAVLVAAPLPVVPPPAAADPATSPETLHAVAKRDFAQESQVKAHAPRSDRLAEEVELLSRAETDLHAGRFAAALGVLDEHGRKFARGTLAPERRAARIQALCRLGRTAEADVELARLSPGSLHEARAREACGAKGETAAE